MGPATYEGKVPEAIQRHSLTQHFSDGPRIWLVAQNAAARRMILWNAAKKYKIPLATRRLPIRGGDSRLA
eukprot:8247017-Karenia_brevis.AAC.1